MAQIIKHRQTQTHETILDDIRNPMLIMINVFAMLIELGRVSSV